MLLRVRQFCFELARTHTLHLMIRIKFMNSPDVYKRPIRMTFDMHDIFVLSVRNLYPHQIDMTGDEAKPNYLFK